MQNNYLGNGDFCSFSAVIYLGNTFPQDFLVTLFVDLLSVVVRFQDHFYLFDGSFLSLDFLQELKQKLM